MSKQSKRAAPSEEELAERQVRLDAKKRREGAEKVHQQSEANSGWDDLQVMYQTMVELLVQPDAIIAVLDLPEMQEGIRLNGEKATLDANLNLLAKDSSDLSARLTVIYDQHRDRRGDFSTTDIFNAPGGTDAPEFVQGLKIHEQYIQFAEVYRSSCVPHINEILEIISRAERNLVKNAQARAKLEEAAAAEPVKEVKAPAARGMDTPLIHMDESPFQRPLNAQDQSNG